MFHPVRNLALASMGLALAVPAAAQSPIKLTSTVEIERTATDSSGAKTVSYEAPKVVVPGDRLRFTLKIANSGSAPASNVVINNPIPAAVAFDSTPDQQNFSVSVDGGKNFGELAAATVADTAGAARAATAADVTNVRWVIAKPVPPGGTHSITFFGRVR